MIDTRDIKMNQKSDDRYIQPLVQMAQLPNTIINSSFLN